MTRGSRALAVSLAIAGCGGSTSQEVVVLAQGTGEAPPGAAPATAAPLPKKAVDEDCKQASDCASGDCSYQGFCTIPCTYDDECKADLVCRQKKDQSGAQCVRPVGVPVGGACLLASECQSGRCIHYVGKENEPGLCTRSCKGEDGCPSGLKICTPISDSGPVKLCLPGASLTPRAVHPSPPPSAVLAGPSPFGFQGGGLVLPAAVLFQTGSDALRSGADVHLAVAFNYLQAKPEVTLLRIEGHTDNQGNAAMNQVLSEKRALAAARWLVARGIACQRLLPVGFGEARPITPNDTSQGRDQNRRLVLVNAAIRGRAIGNMPVDGGGKPAGDPCK